MNMFELDIEVLFDSGVTKQYSKFITKEYIEENDFTSKDVLNNVQEMRDLTEKYFKNKSEFKGYCLSVSETCSIDMSKVSMIDIDLKEL